MDSCYVLLSMLERVYSSVEELLNIERSIFMRKVMNVVACEGLDRSVPHFDYCLCLFMFHG